MAQDQGYRVMEKVSEDASGASLNRPGLDKIRDMAEAGEIQVVICLDPDRLSRDLAHSMLLTREFERRGVDLLFVNIPKDNSPAGNLLFNIRAVFAEFERSQILERTRRGKTRRSREGKVMGGGASPFGYRYVVGEGRFEVIEAEAQWVLHMFNWVAGERYSLYKVADRLNEFCVPTKQGAPKWCALTVRGILKNPMYTGTWFWSRTRSIEPQKSRVPANARKSEKTSRVQRDRSEWIAVPVTPLISQETFDAAQHQLKLNRDLSSRNAKHTYLLRGILSCGECGGRLRGHAMRNYRCYECSGRQQTLPTDQRCRAKPYNADKIESLIWDEMERRLSNPDLIIRTLQDQDKLREEDTQRDDSELLALIDTELVVKREEDKLLDLYMAELIDKEKLQDRMSILKKKRAAIEKAKGEMQVRREQHE